MFNRMIWAVALAIFVAAPAAKTFAADDHHTVTSSPAQSSGGNAHAAAGGHEKADLMPDMSKTTSWVSALWVVIIFLIVLAILYPTAWKNVLAGLKAREQRIRADIAQAEAARAKAEATLKEYNTQLAAAEQRIRDMITAATADGERMAAQIRARAETEAQDVKVRATKEIEAAKHQAIAEIYDQAATLATSVAEKILRRNLNANDQRDLVTRSLDQVQTIKNN